MKYAFVFKIYLKGITLLTLKLLNVLSVSNLQFRIAELRAESSPKCEWSIEEMSNVLFEEAKDLYELCERTLADAIQSPEELQKGTKPEKRFFAYWSLASMLGMVSFIEVC
jgi:hypothetical protein